MRAAQTADAGELRHRIGFAGARANDAGAVRVEAIAQWPGNRHTHDIAAGALEAIGGVACVDVVDADHRGAVLLDLGHQQGLERGVILHAAVTVQMIGRYVQENADGGAQRRRQIDLVGRDFEHVTAAGCERLQRQRGDADIAAHLRIAAGMIDQMRDQRRGGRFAVGAGNRN